VSHCLRKLPPSSNEIPAGNIVAASDGAFTVTSVDSDGVYTVRLRGQQHPDLPSCDCVDWTRHYLPCKHLLAVIVQSTEAGGWESLPAFYRSFPLFTIDPDILPSATEAVDSARSEAEPVHATAETAQFAAESSQTSAEVEPVQVETVDKLQSRLRQVLAGVSGCTYAISDVQFLCRSLEVMTQMLHDCQAHCDSSVHRAAFRRNRRLVKASVAAVGLRRRLSVLRALRKRRRRQEALRRLHTSGMFTTSASLDTATTESDWPDNGH